MAHPAQLLFDPLTIHFTNLNDPGPENDYGGTVRVTGMVTPAEPKELDEKD
jgi:hypothetical protein